MKQLSKFLADLEAENPASFVDAVENHVRIISGEVKLDSNYTSETLNVK